MATGVMEVEGVTKSKGFYTKEMWDLFNDTNFSLSFMYKDREVADSNQRRCTLCGGNFKANDPVTKLRQCGHIFHSECYLGRLMVSSTVNSHRTEKTARSAVHQRTSAPLPRRRTISSWCCSLSPEMLN